jgi:translation initiation factor IF-2
MSDKKTVFAIMRELGVDYETIVKIAKSAKINVIKSPNTVVAPRYLKKIMKASEAYQAALNPSVSAVLESPPKEESQETAGGEAVAVKVDESPVLSGAEKVVDAESSDSSTVSAKPEATVDVKSPSASEEKERTQDLGVDVVADTQPESSESSTAEEHAQLALSGADHEETEAQSQTSEESSQSITSDETPKSSGPDQSTESAVELSASSSTDSESASGAESSQSKAKPTAETAQTTSQRRGKREIVVKRPAELSGGKLQATKTGRSIPLEQLQARTHRSAPPRRPGGGRPSNDQQRSRPRNPRPNTAAAAAPAPAPAETPNPNKEIRRRVRVTPKAEDINDRQKNLRQARRRQEVRQNELYGGSNRPSGHRSRRKKGRRHSKQVITTPAAHKRIVRVDESMSVGELGRVMGVKASDLIRKLMELGVMATITQQLDFATIDLIAPEFRFEAKNVAFDEQELLSGPGEVEEVEEDPDAILRAPVVTIMGHVDHGKTTLLDRIRSANVAGDEAGGITQHIGAYRVETENGPVVFLDTPGHAAFSAMRARGASVTDLVVLVVAADDGVMPQTLESINHAKAAKVPVIVAVNKCDKEGVNTDRIRQELSAHELIPEEWGGDTMFVNISALRGDGVDNLIDSLALQAEVLDLKANHSKPAYGRVVEARIDKGRGTVVTVLVQEGTLKKSDYMLVGQRYGRVRMMMDHYGKTIKEAGPSTPVELTGLNGVPAAGEEFYLVKNERDAKRIVSNRETKAKEAHKPGSILSADPWNTSIKKYQHLILKADVSGSLEAIRASIEALSTDEVEVKVITSGIGQVTESDISLAQASEATVLGFNVGADNKAKRIAEKDEISITRYSIIYELIDHVKDLMSGLLEPEVVEERLGKVQVRQVFHIQKIGFIAGSFVLDGKVNRNAHARVLREGDQVHEGRINTLKRFKDDVREVSSGYECGIAIDGYKDVQEGDMLEIIEYKEIRRRIDDVV